QAGSAGLGAMLGAWGALSADVTHARSQRYGDNTRSGQRWRVRYNEGLASGTTLSMASEEYDSEGYSSLTETLNTWCEGDHQCRYSFVYRPLKQKS
ncbi:capsule biosynthesis protein, partial [Salmonella enterica subsp. enterica serovar Java]|nr:capsule biosynthesis protein [Salmonella enterica subsp. enterica serovar Java]EBV8366207.1 capsule biosynthesis protein [Salmonella enterica subsp. enterica serovar Java]EBW5122692.1 capsule biosynthesis protein [Salmonella enterica subsp. enterica serovar Java]EBX9117707.1 capsule biosynthesis protein [Salmonella enterica subsp. enterica serovar Java]ECB7405211.1 capsule biosynthesis protein [Salmonella enterica subsp. enterica serovar Java]